MASHSSILCPRCGRQNLSRARYCGQCGLNLAAAGADEVARALRRNGRQAGTGLILFLILLGLFLAALSSLFRVASRTTCPYPAPRQVISPYQHRNGPWLNDDARERPTQRWRAEWHVER